MSEELEDGLQMVKVSDLQQGPIRHDELSPEVLTQLEQIYRDAAHYIDNTLEEFERAFMRDVHPEREVAVWRTIADAFLLYRERHCNGRELSRNEGADLVHALIGISMGVGLVTDVRELKSVDKYVGRRLIKCWESL